MMIHELILLLYFFLEVTKKSKQTADKLKTLSSPEHEKLSQHVNYFIGIIF